jgi:dolichol-phosphate mannosyltransferase
MGFTGTVEKMIKARLMRASVGAVPFVLRYDNKQSSSKVVTSLTTMGYLVLIAKYVVFWGDVGRRWKGDIEERQRRRYDDEGRLRQGPVSLS